jgi:hypothetical protein
MFQSGFQINATNAGREGYPAICLLTLSDDGRKIRHTHVHDLIVTRGIRRTATDESEAMSDVPITNRVNHMTTRESSYQQKNLMA